MKTLVDSGALTMALNVLRRAGKDEVVDELEKTAVRGPELRVPLYGGDIVSLASFAGFQVVGEEVEDDGYLDAQYSIIPCPESGVRVDDDVLRFSYVVVSEEDPDQGCLPLGEGVPLGSVTADTAPEPKESTKCRALQLLDKHGICLTCGELYEHDYDAPFASCGCGQSEWYKFTPHMLAVKAAKEQ